MADDVIVLRTQLGFYEVLSDSAVQPHDEELQPNTLPGATGATVLSHDFHERVRPWWPYLLFASVCACDRLYWVINSSVFSGS